MTPEKLKKRFSAVFRPLRLKLVTTRIEVSVPLRFSSCLKTVRAVKPNFMLPKSQREVGLSPN